MISSSDLLGLLGVIFSGQDLLVEGSVDDTYVVLRNKGSIRWIIPQTNFAAYTYLSQWRPYGLLSRFFWKLILLCYRLRILHRLPGVEAVRVSRRIVLSDMLNCHDRTQCLAVIYVGVPCATQKIVVGLVDALGDVCGIAKFPLNIMSCDNILNEYAALKHLCDVNFLCAPRNTLVTINGVTIQSLVVGKLPGVHFSYLQQVFFEKFYSKFEFVQSCSYLLSLKKNAIFNDFVHKYFCVSKLVQLLSCRKSIKIAMSHGDFVPWNTLVGSHGLFAIDWEYFSDKRVMYFDIFHFHYSLYKLSIVKELPVKSMKGNHYVCRLFGADMVTNIFDLYHYFYLLEMLFRKAKEGDVSSVEFYLVHIEKCVSLL